MDEQYTYKAAWEELAAHVRKLGFLADVLEDDNGLYFGDAHHERWTRAQILIVVSSMQRIEKLIQIDTNEIPF